MSRASSTLNPRRTLMVARARSTSSSSSSSSSSTAVGPLSLPESPPSSSPSPSARKAPRSRVRRPAVYIESAEVIRRARSLTPGCVPENRLAAYTLRPGPVASSRIAPRLLLPRLERWHWVWGVGEDVARRGGRCSNSYALHFRVLDFSRSRRSALPSYGACIYGEPEFLQLYQHCGFDRTGSACKMKWKCCRLDAKLETKARVEGHSCLEPNPNLRPNSLNDLLANLPDKSIVGFYQLRHRSKSITGFKNKALRIIASIYVIDDSLRHT
jgi:hypothetical protein